MKNRILSTLLIVTLILSFGLVAPAPVAAQSTINVGPGETYTTIQEAVDVASSGDTILVAAGTYPEDITIDKPLTIISSGEGNYPIIDGQSTGYQGAVNIAANDVTFGGDGVGFVVWGAGQAAVYFAQPVSGCVVEDNEIVAAPNKNALVTVGGQANHAIVGNSFTGPPASQLVYVNGMTSVSVASVNVDFIGNEFTGSATGPALGQEASDSEISGNTFATVTGYASLELWVDSTVTGNSFTADLPAGGVYVMDNTGFGPGIPGGGDYVLDIDAVLANNTFLRAAVVEHPGASRLPAIWANIQGAVDAAVAGDTVDVIAGTYVENVVIPADKDGLQLIGADSDVTSIAPTSGRPVALGGNLGLIDGVRVEGFTLVTADANYALIALSGTAVAPPNTTNLELEDIVVDGGTYGVGLNAVDGATLTNVHLSNVSGGGQGALELTGVSNLLFMQGSIEDNDIGVRLQVSPTNPPYGPNGNIQIHLTNFCNNGVAIENQDSSVDIDATNNYWCSPSGPTHNPGYGDPVGDYVLYDPWLLEPFDPEGPPPTAFDKTLPLNVGWTLVSTDGYVDPASVFGDGVTLAYEYTPTGGYSEVTPADLVPVNALFLKTETGDGVGIVYSGGVPVASSKDLETGWNLVSSATIDDAKSVLSPLRYIQVGEQQGVGMTTLVSQGDYNQNTDSFYLATLGPGDWNELGGYELNPFDGYWVYMNAAKSFGVIPQ